MDNNVEIKIANIADPPEKMRLMYEAVSQLLLEHRELSTIKVSEITAKAGIGKGTAYEYFSSKEELISHALMYEYSNKIQRLAVSAFEPEHFKDRCDRVMDWIRDNREYNLMFSQLFRSSRAAEGGGVVCPLGGANLRNTSPTATPYGEGGAGQAVTGDFGVQGEAGQAVTGEFDVQAHRYIYQLIDRFMEDAYKEGAITETDTGKRALAFLTAMVEYAFVIMGPQDPRYSHLGEENLRTFIYESLILSLKGEIGTDK